MKSQVSRFAVVETSDIGNNVTISEFSVIRKGVIIEDNVFIHPNVVINSGTILKNGIEIFPGVLIGREPKGPKASGVLARPLKYEKKVIIGENCSIGPNAIIYFGTKIGPNTLIGDAASIREQSIIGEKCIIGRYVSVNYETVIGSGTKIMDMTHITGKCKIGKDVFIGMLVATANDNKLMAREYNETEVAGPIIMDNATIGSGASILPGVRIGKYAVVGAQALVSKNVLDYQVVVGIPARFQAWICRCGMKLEFRMNEEVCGSCGRKYRKILENGIEEVSGLSKLGF